MHDDIRNNKYSLLNIKVKYKWFLVCSAIMITLILITSISVKTYDTYNYMGVVNKNKIILNVKSDKLNDVLNSKYIKINNKKMQFSILSVNDIQYNEITFENYNQIAIKVKNSYIENQSVNVSFYTNKQRIIKKLINLLN